MNKYFSNKGFVNRVYLYGSYAKGNATANSDIDLVIELDYEQLADKTLDFLAISTELSLLLSTKVSVATTASFSKIIKAFAGPGSVKIFDRNDKHELEWPDRFDNFDKAEYRDLARLEHIKNSLNLILSWTEEARFSGFEQNSMLASACLQELRIVAGLTSRLTQSTKDELLLKVQSIKEALYVFDIITILKAISGPYFGNDLQVLKNVIIDLVPSMSNAVDNLLKNWTGRYKQRLSNHFINYLRLKLNSEFKFRQSLISDLEEIDNAIRETVEKRKLGDLVPKNIKEGERNLNWIASQLNIKKTWKTVKDLICPFFPVC